MMQAAQPTLYRTAADGTVQLLLARCPSCGVLTFPATAPGCRACGHPLEQGETVAHTRAAKLLDFVEVHVAVVPGLRVPYLSAEVELVPGLVVGAALAERPAGTFLPGMAVVAQAQAEPDGTFRCVFAPMEGRAA